MKALHIMYEYGTRGVGGAAAAASRLHLDMLERGVDSRVVCVWKTMNNEECIMNNCGRSSVYCLRTRWWWFLNGLVHKLTGKWSHRLALPGFEKVVREFQPDEIHLHWMRRPVVSWSQLSSAVHLHLSPSPTLYVHLHDLWAIEQREIVALEPTFVAYSDYVANLVRGKGLKVERRQLILDKIFRRMNNEECRMNNCGRNRPLIVLFGCKDGRSNPDKGFPLLAQALEMLPVDLQKKVELRIFGEEGKENVRNSSLFTIHYSLKFLGRIDDPVRLRSEYQAASCFAFPSVHETMGMTKLEALACGCPVVAFDREACAEGIVHGKTGYVAKDGDVRDFARGLERYLAV